MTTEPGAAPPAPQRRTGVGRLARMLLGVVLTLAIVAVTLYVVFDHRLGNGTQGAPTVQPALSKVAAGNGHSCAVTEDGHVKCWGGNEDGQLGDGTFVRRLSATAVPGLEQARAVATGSGGHTCALTGAGAAKCWGANEFGQLGNGDTAASSIPVQVSGLESGVLAIAVGRSHSCAVTTKGLMCWGSNQTGELGLGTVEASLTPQVVEGFGAHSAVALSDSLSCAINPQARLFCWGDDADGQLGDRNFTASSSPVPVEGVPPVVAVSASDTHVCAVTAESDLWCWGANGAGQLGLGSTSASEQPSPVPGVRDVVSVAAGHQRTCVVHRDRTATCWGSANTASTQPSPMPTDLGPDISDLSLGTFHGCLTTVTQSVKCWGANTTGQLGDGTTTTAAQPVAVMGF